MANRGPLAVVDANVVASGVVFPVSVPGRVLQAWQAQRFVLLSSAGVASEISGVLHRPHIRARHTLNDEQLVRLLNSLRENRVHPLPFDDLPVHCRDPKDDVVLACALAGNAAFIVTGDADLLALNGDPALGDLRIVTPRTFLEMLDADDTPSL